VNWLKSLFSNPKVQAALLALLTAVLTALGNNAMTKAPVVNVPPAVDNYLLMPSPVDLDVAAAMQAAPGQGHRPFLMELAKIKAGRRYAAEHGMSDREGITLMRAIPQPDVDAAIAKANFSFDAAPVGGPLTGLLDWLKANPQFLENLVKIFLLLAPLFA
jgi:hypothetical protein